MYLKFFIFVLILPLAVFYYQKAESQTYIEYGLASFYSDELNGKRTSSGEHFNNKKFTGAHRTLPFNSIVRVTNLTNNKTVDVKINDRGPASKKRLIDITRAAAKELDMIHSGIIKVKIELLNDSLLTAYNKQNGFSGTDSSSVPFYPGQSSMFEVNVTPIDTNGIGIQVCSFQYIDNMLNELVKIRNKLNYKPLVQTTKVKNIRFYRIIIGPFSDKLKAEEAFSQIKTIYPNSFIVNFDQLK
jgi:rare lipoprotein A